MEIFVNIDVDDVEKAIAFYRDALDLGVGRRFFNGSVIEMTGASSKLFLLTKPSGSSASARAEIYRTYRRHWTPVHLDFVVDDIAAAVQRAVSAGASLENDIRSSAWGLIAMLSDPFGHGFCLLQFTGKDYDEVA